jgi:hypothetical protein
MSSTIDRLLDLEDWSLIGTAAYPRRKMDLAGLSRLKRAVKTVTLRKSDRLCRGTRNTARYGSDGALRPPAMWFAFSSKLCELESRAEIYFYRPKPSVKHRITLLDLREVDKQRGYVKAQAAFELLAGQSEGFDYNRDGLVPLMLHRKLDSLGVHGWIAYDDKNEVEVLLLHPSRLLEGKFASKSHKKLPPKKRRLFDGRQQV